MRHCSMLGYWCNEVVVFYITFFFNFIITSSLIILNSDTNEFLLSNITASPNKKCKHNRIDSFLQHLCTKTLHFLIFDKDSDNTDISVSYLKFTGAILVKQMELPQNFSFCGSSICQHYFTKQKTVLKLFLLVTLLRHYQSSL